MNNPIRDMRERLSEQLGGNVKPNKGLKLTSFRPTANDMPRLPQSSIPRPKQSYDRVGRPSKPQLYTERNPKTFGEDGYNGKSLQG